MYSVYEKKKFILELRLQMKVKIIFHFIGMKKNIVKAPFVKKMMILLMWCARSHHC